MLFFNGAGRMTSKRCLHRVAIAGAVLAIIFMLTQCGCNVGKTQTIVSERNYGKAISADCAPGGWSPDRMNVVTERGVIVLTPCVSAFPLGDDVWVHWYTDGKAVIEYRQCWVYTAGRSFACS